MIVLYAIDDAEMKLAKASPDRINLQYRMLNMPSVESVDR